MTLADLDALLATPGTERIRIDGTCTHDGVVWTVDVVTDMAAGHARGRELERVVGDAAVQVVNATLQAGSVAEDLG